MGGKCLDDIRKDYVGASGTNSQPEQTLGSGTPGLRRVVDCPNLVQRSDDREPPLDGKTGGLLERCDHPDSRREGHPDYKGCCAGAR